MDLKTLIDTTRSAKRALRPDGSRPSYGEIASRAGISRYYLYLLMQGASEPSERVVRSLAHAIGTTLRNVRNAAHESRLARLNGR